MAKMKDKRKVEQAQKRKDHRPPFEERSNIAYEVIDPS
jgi:hypothetical protein